MKKFIGNLLLFVVLLVIVNQVPGFFLNPYYGNIYHTMKYNYYFDNREKFNAAVFGSSRSFRHINPEILDQQLSEYGMSTFNFGFPGTGNPEIYFLYEAFLDGLNRGDIKYAFVELLSLQNPGMDNLNTSRNYYWRNFDYLLYAVEYALAEPLSIIRKIELIFKYVASYCYSLLNFHVYSSLGTTGNERVDVFLGVNRDGYHTLEAETEGRKGRPTLKQRRADLIARPELLQERAARALEGFSAPVDVERANPIHLRKLMHLISRSERKGIQLIFFIPLRLVKYAELLAIQRSLPENSVLEFANPTTLPEFYMQKYSFDVGHLNSRGAQLFTEHLAAAIRAQITCHDGNFQVHSSVGTSASEARAQSAGCQPKP